ncbi:MAG: excinuclease ABC subunit UvrC [Zetaproteobacteria bacterium]|nr:excinuclease ABC subunit UvrC [Zetaproteobacteria bacterium]
MWIEPPIQLRELPTEPGVYRMLDSKRKVLYIGKARNLKKRVSSYFQREPDTSRIRVMVTKICDISVTVTQSEVEALVVEHNLIKQLKPRYNVLLKDSKSYPYILLTREDYPKLRSYRGSRKEAGEYFGPFPNSRAVHATIHKLQQIFKVRDCDESTFRNRTRPCMQHQIGRCSAPCCHITSPIEYQKQIEQLRQFLRGENSEILAAWEAEMQHASTRMHFEKAAQLRDQIRDFRTILAGSGQSDLPYSADCIVVLRDYQHVSITIGVRRSGQDLGTHTIRVQQAHEAPDLEILQSLFLERYQHEAWPSEILLATDDATATQLQTMCKWLQPAAVQPCKIKTPKRGSRHTWLQQVSYSGTQTMSTQIHESQKMQSAFEAVATLLKLNTTPKLIAAVDNAHLGGQQTVAAITYLGWQGPDKNLYRRYKLDHVPAGDDYAAMAQVLTRFFQSIQSGETTAPDILFVDGGKGQLSVAMTIAASLNLAHLAMVGVAKGAARKVGNETLWPSWDVAGARDGLTPGYDSAALLLIARVRDEAHRFAGQYMRKRKNQSMFTSTLDQIPGIGDKKRLALLQHFGGIEGVKKASRDQLMATDGISLALAERIFEALHQ